MLQLPLTNTVSTVTQNKGCDITGDPSHTADKEQDGEHGPRGGEDLEQDGDGHECHGPKQDGFSSKPAAMKQSHQWREEQFHRPLLVLTELSCQRVGGAKIDRSDVPRCLSWFYSQ